MPEERKDIFRDIRHIQEEMDLLFDHFYKIRTSPILTSHRLWRPHIDVFNLNKEMVVICELAGVQESEVAIALAHNILTIRGERAQKKFAERAACHNCEIPTGKFERNVHLPEPGDPEKVAALLHDGMLEIRVGKLPQNREKSRTVEIEPE